jgi:hypothetical protein
MLIMRCSFSRFFSTLLFGNDNTHVDDNNGNDDAG